MRMLSRPSAAPTVRKASPTSRGFVEACQLGTAVRRMPWIIAYDGQDPLEYAQAAAGIGPEGITGNPKLELTVRYPTASHLPSQSLKARNQAFLDTHGMRRNSNPNPFMFGVPTSILRAGETLRGTRQSSTPRVW